MWRLKALIQALLALTPGGEHVNYLLQLLRGSHHPRQIARLIAGQAEETALIGEQVPLAGRCVVEIGTGWVPLPTLLLYLVGADTIHTYDHVAHLRVSRLRDAIDLLGQKLDAIASATMVPSATLAERLDRVRPVTDLGATLDRMGIVYHAPGDAASTGLPGASVDLVCSYAVLEHVPEQLVGDLTEEAKRILKPGGLAFHTIGLHDHFASIRGVSRVNFLKYSPRSWRLLCQNRISYHNRLREKQFLAIFRSHGAEARVLKHAIRPEELEALRTLKVHECFAGMTPEELAVTKTTIALSFSPRDAGPSR